MSIGTKVGLAPGYIVCYMGTPPQKKGAQPPNFLPMSIVAKRSPISATAEHLLNFGPSFISLQRVQELIRR